VRPRQPRHIEAEVVGLAKVNVRADSARLQDGQEGLRLGFDDESMAQEVERAVLRGGDPSRLGRAALRLNDRLKGMLPGAGGNPGVAAGEACLGELEVDRRLPQSLVPGEHDLPGRVRVVGFEADAFSGEGVDAIETAAAFTAGDEPVPDLHKCLALVLQCKAAGTGNRTVTVPPRCRALLAPVARVHPNWCPLGISIAASP